MRRGGRTVPAPRKALTTPMLPTTKVVALSGSLSGVASLSAKPSVKEGIGTASLSGSAGMSAKVDLSRLTTLVAGSEGLTATATTTVAKKQTAWQTEAIVSGTVEEIQLHGSSAEWVGVTSVSIGIFADNGGLPGVLLGKATFAGKPPTNEWFNIKGLTVKVTKGAKYWLAFVTVGGTARFLGTATGTATLVKSTKTTYNEVTETTEWGAAEAKGPLSFYATGAPNPTNLLIGNEEPEPFGDTVLSNKIAAAQFTARETGTIEELWLWTRGEKVGVTSVSLAVAAEGASMPGAILGAAKKEGALEPIIKITGLSIPVKEGTKYWLEINPHGGTLEFEVAKVSGGTPIRLSTKATYTNLPEETSEWGTPEEVGPPTIAAFGMLSKLIALTGAPAGVAGLSAPLTVKQNAGGAVATITGTAGLSSGLRVKKKATGTLVAKAGLSASLQEPEVNLNPVPPTTFILKPEFVGIGCSFAYGDFRRTYNVKDHLVGTEIPKVENEDIKQGLRDSDMFVEH